MKTKILHNQNREKNTENRIGFLKTSILKCSKSLLAFLFTAFAASNLMAGDLTVNVTSSNGGSLTGAKFSVTRGPNHIGNYDAGSTVSLVDGGSYTIFAYYNGTSTKREVFVSTAGGEVFNFSTTNVKFNFSGGYLNFKTSGSWSSFGKTNGVWNDQELFPRDFYGNMMTIQTGYLWNDVRSASFEVNYEGQQNFHRNINVLRVLADDNSAISGASARGGNGTNFSGWHVSGSTNAQGLLVDLRPYSANGTYSYEARVNNTTATTGSQATSSNSYFLFKTIKLTLKLETCSGTPLAGGKARFGNGNSFGTWFFPTPNNTDVNGLTSAQFFPGTYSIEMGYQSSTEVKSAVTIPNSNTTLTWKTTSLTLNWPGDIAYGGNGDSRFFNKPSMELLPGTINFNFRGNGNNYQAIVISGCSMNPTTLRVINELGEGVSGTSFTPAVGGSWSSTLTGSTNGNGFYFVNGIPSGTTKIKANLPNSSKEMTMSELASSNNTFTTQKVCIVLKNAAGNEITDQLGSASQGGGSWTTLGNFNNQGKLFVNTFSAGKYRVTYNNTTEEKTETIVVGSGIQEIIFQTGKVISSCGHSQISAGGWSAFTSGNEYMPGNRTFRSPSITATVVAGQTIDLCDNGNYTINTDNNSYSNSNYDGISIFPNPSSDLLNVIVAADDKSNVSFSIFDAVTGKSIYNFSSIGSVNETINVSSFSSGLYYIQINNAGKINNQKFIVK